MNGISRFLAALRSYLVRNRGTLALLFCGILAPLLFFGVLAENVHRHGGLGIDRPLLHFIHQYANPRDDAWVAWVTRAARYAAIPVLLMVAFGIRRMLDQPRGAAFFAISMAGSTALNLMAKLFFERARPALWQSPVPESTFSFPSGHAMVSMTAAIALSVVLWPTKLRWLVLFAAPCVMVISGSRLYLGVHYPSDILAGWCAGGAWTVGVWAIIHRTSRAASEVIDGTLPATL